MEELKKFQEYPGKLKYKLIVVDYVSSAIIFRGNVEDYSKVIYLVKHEAHYNGLRSMIAFLNRSYFCPDCCKGYNEEDAAHNTCLTLNCSSCQRTSSWKGNGGCPDFKPGKVRTIHCKDCQQDFYGENCYKDHKVKKGKKKLSLCEKKRKCLICCAHYEVNPKQPHKCYGDNCRHCGKIVRIYNHKCYIQLAEKEQSKIEEQERSPIEEQEAEIDEKKKKKRPPLFVI